MTVVRGLSLIWVGEFMSDTRHRPKLWGIVGKRFGLLFVTTQIDGGGA